MSARTLDVTSYLESKALSVPAYASAQLVMMLAHRIAAQARTEGLDLRAGQVCDELLERQAIAIAAMVEAELSTL